MMKICVFEYFLWRFKTPWNKTGFRPVSWQQQAVHRIAFTHTPPSKRATDFCTESQKIWNGCAKQFCVLLRRFHVISHSFACFRTVSRAFAQFRVLLHTFACFCMVLHSFAWGWLRTHVGGFVHMWVASHTCGWLSTLVSGFEQSRVALSSFSWLCCLEGNF